MELKESSAEGFDFKSRWPSLLASTGSVFSCSISQFRLKGEGCSESNPNLGTQLDVTEKADTNYFKSILWSPDGTCLLTNSADEFIRTFIAPSNLLAPHNSPITLTPYSTLSSPEPIYSLTPYPRFSLQDQSTTLILSSPRDLPIRLSNALYPSTVATYSLVSPSTEAYLTPSSLLWSPDGTSFFTGTESLIAHFDVSRPGSGPMTSFPTIPSKRHKIKGGGIGMRGIVSCLSLQGSSTLSTANHVLAAGTWTRWISLYDAAGLGGTIANWSISQAADSDAKISGAGVSQVLWSPCGRYLFAVERKSRGVLIYDIRVTGRLVGWLEGRSAETNQRLSVDIFPCMDNDGIAEVWAGGIDGIAKVWKWKGTGDGENGAGTSPSEKWKAHEAAVTGVAVHPSGTVVATSSGQRQEMSEFDNEEYSEGNHEDTSNIATSITSICAAKHQQSLDNSIKLWGLGSYILS